MVFDEWCLPSVTLGKEFAECKLSFAECNRHSAKRLNPVVTIVMIHSFFRVYALNNVKNSKYKIS